MAARGDGTRGPAAAGGARRVRHALLAAATALSLAAGAAWAAADPLLDAARANDAPAALAALAAGAAVDAKEPDGTTALHWAAYHANAGLVERLLAAGADPNAVNDYGSRPLSEAAIAGDARIIEMLLDAGAEVDAPGADGQTPLMIVARSSNVEAARLLLEHGANVNAREQWRQQTALMWAAAQRQPDMVKLLIEHGAELDARSAVNHWPRQVSGEARRMYRPTGGLTALLFAAREGCKECARHLVEAGADPNLADPKNVTPLFLAIDNLHFDTAKYLIEAGADPNRWDWWGRTPLYAAVDMNTLPHGGRPDRLSTDETTSLELIEMLLARGANPNLQLKLIPPYRSIVDDRGCDSMLTTGTTPLLRAAKTFDVPAMRLLIEHGALLELPNQDGITPLMAAAGYGSVECDPRGYGPGIPHYTTADVQEKSIQALEVLIAAGADVNAHTTRESRFRSAGQTALFGAAIWGWNDVAEFLVEHGARIDVADSRGRTPVDAALGRAGGRGRGSTAESNPETAKLLEELCAKQDGCDLANPARYQPT
ncbi:MAG TPA: ankyrin repeat domain-containing protein [Gammaproteobacteria bacterium]